MLFRMLLIASLVGAVPVFSDQAPPPSPCDSPRHHDLDFWVGEWNVTNAAGQSSGRSRVERLFGGCVIVENWTSTRGSYSGMSLNTFDPATSRWTQHWVDSSGLSVEMDGAFQEKNLVYTRRFRKADGTPVVSRMTFFPLPEGVRQLVEQTADGGATWTTQYDLRYARK